MNRIMIIEDDILVREELSKLLIANHYEIKAPQTFHNLQKEIETWEPNLILLDINLPEQTGFDLCREIRKNLTTSIIFVTSRNTEEDELKSLLCGGDDFITKPYHKGILLEKIKRMLEKSNPQNYREITEKGVTLDLHLSLIKANDKEIELTRNEFRILYYLFLHPNEDISKEDIIEDLWNDKCYVDENILNVNMARIRKKLEEIGIHDFITTIHGKGYRL